MINKPLNSYMCIFCHQLNLKTPQFSVIGTEPLLTHCKFRTTAKYRDVFCNDMMIHELGLTPPDDDDSPIKSGQCYGCVSVQIVSNHNNISDRAVL